MDPRLEKLIPHVPLGLALAGAGMLLGAFAFQYIGGLQPCILCYWQRWPHGIAAILGLVAWLLRDRDIGPWLTALTAVTLLVGAGIGFFHAGVELKYWEGTAECGSVAQPDNLEALMKMLDSQPVVRCDEVPWSLFGISMAGYNFLISKVIGLIGLFGAYRVYASRRQMQ